VCRNGKILKDGMCVCPSDTIENDGTCVPIRPVPGDCSSGIEAGKCLILGFLAVQTDERTGKCYTWTFPNGERFGYNANGWYTASKESRHQQFGKFKLCKDERCLPGAINPGDGFSAQDLHGQANGKNPISSSRYNSNHSIGGQNTGQWLDAKQNGGHIGKTPTYDKAGKFTITKWPCGKYCLGGFGAGLGEFFQYTRSRRCGKLNFLFQQDLLVQAICQLLLSRPLTNSLAFLSTSLKFPATFIIRRTTVFGIMGQISVVTRLIALLPFCAKVPLSSSSRGSRSYNL
jgi:hypothetical protein